MGDEGGVEFLDADDAGAGEDGGYFEVNDHVAERAAGFGVEDEEAEGIGVWVEARVTLKLIA